MVERRRLRQRVRAYAMPETRRSINFPACQTRTFSVLVPTFFFSFFEI